MSNQPHPFIYAIILKFVYLSILCDLSSGKLGDVVLGYDSVMDYTVSLLPLLPIHFVAYMC